MSGCNSTLNKMYGSKICSFQQSINGISMTRTFSQFKSFYDEFDFHGLCLSGISTIHFYGLRICVVSRSLDANFKSINLPTPDCLIPRTSKFLWFHGL